MENERDELCEHFLNVSNNRYFHFVLVSQIIFCSVGILFQILLSLAVRRMHSLHRNTKILLAYHVLGVLLHCAAKLALHGNDLYIFLFVSSANRCGFLPTNVRCFAFRLPITLGMQIAIFASAAVMIERFIATKRSKVYERYGTALGNALGLGSLLLSLGSMAIMSYDEDFSAKSYRSYCTTSDNNNKKRVMVVLSLNVVVELVNVVIFPILFFVNKNLRRAGIEKTLSGNYQLMENIRSISVLTPFAITQMIFVTFYVVTVFSYTMFSQSVSPEFYPAYLESVSLIPVYAVMLPVITWFTNRRITKQSNDRLSEGMKKQDMDHYFKTLHNNWQTKT